MGDRPGGRYLEMGVNGKEASILGRTKACPVKTFVIAVRFAGVPVASVSAYLQRRPNSGSLGGPSKRIGARSIGTAPDESA